MRVRVNDLNFWVDHTFKGHNLALGCIIHFGNKEHLFFRSLKERYHYINSDA